MLVVLRPETGRVEGSTGWNFTPTGLSTGWNLTPTGVSNFHKKTQQEYISHLNTQPEGVPEVKKGDLKGGTSLLTLTEGVRHIILVHQWYFNFSCISLPHVYMHSITNKGTMSDNYLLMTFLSAAIIQWDVVAFIGCIDLLSSCKLQKFLALWKCFSKQPGLIWFSVLNTSVAICLPH